MCYKTGQIYLLPTDAEPKVDLPALCEKEQG
jgi:hypothetical protein